MVVALQSGTVGLESLFLTGNTPFSSMTPKSSGRLRSSSIPAVAMWLALHSFAFAHEGHAPLPTKGVQVDVDKGLATLSDEARKALGVETADVVEGQVAERVMSYARVTVPWQQHHFITSTVSGRIATLLAKPGQEVKQGQLLAEIQSPALDTLQTELLAAINNYSLSTAQLDRKTGLAEAEVVAGRDLMEAISINRQNQYAVEIARSKLQGVGLSKTKLDALSNRGEAVKSLPIVSPSGGVIIHSDLIVGKVVRPTEHLFEVINLAEVDLQVDVLEADMHKVAVGQSVAFVSTTYPDKPFSGQVTIKEPIVEEGSHVGRLWVRLQNDPAFARFEPGDDVGVELGFAVGRGAGDGNRPVLHVGERLLEVAEEVVLRRVRGGDS